MENADIKTVITRFPPSPTGYLHLGSARTALFNFLYSKKNGGKLILRFEDTDKSRTKKEYEQDIFEGLEWLKISCDAVFHQSERTLIYRKYLEKMIADGTAYYSETSNISEFNKSESDDVDDELKDDKEQPVRVIRFRNPNRIVKFNDHVRGEISVDTTELGDFIIARSIEEPLYHFAVVVDDFEMSITHILRGEDGIYNTPRQVLIQEAIGAPRPYYCHIPFVLGSDKTKLSKRHGATSIIDYKKAGYLPEAIVNYLALLGWNPGTDKEIFTMDELISEFDISKIQKSGASFDLEKLRWINREHIKKLDDTTFKKLTLESLPESIKSLSGWNDETFTRILPIIKERVTLLKDITKMAEDGELTYFFENPIPLKNLLMPRGKKSIGEPSEISDILNIVVSLLKKIEDTEWQMNKIKDSLWDYSGEKGRGNVLWPIRVALSGKENSPDPFILGEVLGKARTVERIETAVKILSS